MSFCERLNPNRLMLLLEYSRTLLLNTQTPSLNRDPFFKTLIKLPTNTSLFHVSGPL